MVVTDGKITEATETELFGEYLKREWWEIWSFCEYLNQMERAGTTITGRKTYH